MVNLKGDLAIQQSKALIRAFSRFDTDAERIFHCGASSKDAGKKITSITEYTENDIKIALHTVICKLLTNHSLILS